MPMIADQLPDSLLGGLLEKADDFAVGTVKAGRGGPFAASLHVYDLDARELIQIGGMAANAVLETGMASAHAEDRLLSPENVRMLKDHLARKRGNDIAVILASSGQSCPACHAKSEVAARVLMSENLLPSGRFIVTYGATYEDTKNTALFNDEIYHQDFRRAPPERLVKVVEEKSAGLPDDVDSFFRAAKAPAALIARGGQVLATGRDCRHDDILATAEVGAIRQACARQKREGVTQPWNLDAVLYTTGGDIGPLCYAECQWANVTKVVCLGLQSHEPEAPGIDNRAFYDLMAAGNHRHNQAALVVLRQSPFSNRAQKEWRQRLDDIVKQGGSLESILYNGVGG